MILQNQHFETRTMHVKSFARETKAAVWRTTSLESSSANWFWQAGQQHPSSIRWCWWHLTARMAKDPNTLTTSLCQFTLLELMPGCGLQTTVTRSCCVHAHSSSDHTASVHRCQLCGTISRPNWRTMTLAEHCYKSCLKTWLFECVYCASVTEQYNVVPATERLHSVAGKITVGLASHWPDLVVKWPNEGRWAPCLCSYR